VLANSIPDTDTPSKVKFHFLSGHDNTVALYLTMLKAPQTEAPPFASTVMFKLFRKEADKTEHYVVVEYNGKQIDLTKFCGSAQCPVQEMINSLQEDLIPNI